MFDRIRDVLAQEPRISYALVFGSRTRGNPRSDSDLDVALGLVEPLTVHELGDLIGKLESASGLPVDLMLLDEAGPGLAFRVFKDGIIVLERDRKALINRKTKAMLDYYDWKPFEDIFVRGVLAAAKRGG